MAVPKKRQSKSRKRKRRANWKLTAPTLIECPQCHSFTTPHQVCSECGYYNNKEVIAK